MIAALYIDPRGPYVNRPGVDAWDETRDARLYDGPHAIVAHPPCGPWGALKRLCRRPQDALCAPRAVAQVREFGGVLEHPSGSGLWAYAQLPAPGETDRWGKTYEVEQVAWGHVARKRTWLYIVGVSDDIVMAGIRTGGTVTHWVSGYRFGSQKSAKCTGGSAPEGIKICSAQQRRRTPPAFADWLISLAESVPR